MRLRNLAGTFKPWCVDVSTAFTDVTTAFITNPFTHPQVQLMIDNFERVDASSLVRAIRSMNTVIGLVDVAVLAHALIAAIFVLRRYLCGPKGKIAACHPNDPTDPDSTKASGCAGGCVCCFRCLWRCVCCWCLCCFRHCAPRCFSCLFLTLRATIRGSLAVAAAALLWVSIILLVVLMVVSCFLFIMVMAIGAICGSVDPAVALAINSLGAGFDRAIQAFDNTGIVQTLSDVEASADETFWFMPINVGRKQVAPCRKPCCSQRNMPRALRRCAYLSSHCTSRSSNAPCPAGTNRWTSQQPWTPRL